MATTPDAPRVRFAPRSDPSVAEGPETDAVIRAIAELTSTPAGLASFHDPQGAGFMPVTGIMATRPVTARTFGHGFIGYPEATVFNPYIQAGLAAAAHGPQRSEPTEAVHAFTAAASALRDIAQDAAETLALSREAADPGEWNIKAAKKKLSQVFDQALVQPQRVTRRGGDAVILVQESRYNALTQAAASANASMLDAFKAAAPRGANLPDVTYPEPLAVSAPWPISSAWVPCAPS